jgi:ADP-ribose pyrophosphatase YjhB (NUDIX family)
MASPSAVAIVETPGSFVLEGRPDIPGALAHSGKAQLFGGHINEGELSVDAVKRELVEELDLQLEKDPSLVWAGEVDSQNRSGEPVRRHVSLFHVVIASTVDLRLQVSGEIVEIPKTLEGVEANQDRLTPFALKALRRAVTGEAWE